MNRNYFYAGLGVLVLAIIVISFFSRNDSGLIAETENIVSVDELAQHSIAEDCWISYNGKVYDVTEFLPKHPGSAGAISPYCGTAEGFEEAFTKKHGTSKASMLMQVGRLMGDFEVRGSLD